MKGGGVGVRVCEDSEVELSLTRLNVTDVHSNKEANHSFGLERVAHLTLAHSRTILKLLANQITYGTLNQKMCVWSARDNNLGKIWKQQDIMRRWDVLPVLRW